MWEDRAEQARERKARLKTFGNHALGLVVEAKEGLFIVDPEDNAVSARLLQDGDYNPAEVQEALRFIRPDSRVLIIGAHIGAHVVALSRHCRGLDAIEANPRTFKFLAANVKLNSCHNVQLLQMAAGLEGETISFLMNTENSGGSKRQPVTNQVYYDYDNPEKVTLTTRALDNVFGSSVFDFVLMDIEGSEFFALQGMQRVLANAKVLAMEFLPFAAREVAGVEINDLSAQILPHFTSMLVPESDQTFTGDRMGAELARMFQANECHDLLYFMKDGEERR